MPRLGRCFLPDQPLHVIQRGNSRAPVFFTEDDDHRYLEWLGECKTVNLAPGMAATVEIKTGKRKLIEFLLSPLTRMTNEAGRER